MPSTCVKIIGRGTLCLLGVVAVLYLAKEYMGLEQREFIILCLTLRNPVLYNPLEERRRLRIQQVADTIQREFEPSSAE